MKKIISLTLLIISIIVFFISVTLIENSTKKTKYTDFKIEKSDDLILNGVVKPAKEIKISNNIPNSTHLLYGTLNNGRFVRKGEPIGSYSYKNTDDNTSLKIKQLTSEKNNLNSNQSVDDQIKINEINKQINDLSQKLYIHDYLAPFNGYIQLDPMDKKNARFISSSQFINTSIGQYDLQTICQNKDVNLLEESTGKKATGKIDYISLLTDSNTKSYSILIKSARKFNYDNSIEIKIPVDKIIIPDTAVNKDVIYIKKNGKYRKVKNEIEKQNNDWVLKNESNVKVGDKILLNYKELPKNER
ncbi:hypothetical protein M3M39_01805 [Fructilactobacillus hinvesii]|uniref:HlyD family efflux transporter periplasmic adaptor subunit n=1 Tax=Fructilactobacillus hinvesii TaxID=2940300 RepID=A0ABY5BSY2_9LACO|nr:hypothetical protein [Fructilactobacillus hinvesii]USS88237.1 hypothetical protein M3M39_01805 [Fructilactobacillus hinvesii]